MYIHLVLEHKFRSSWIRSDSWVTVHHLKDLVKQADTDGPHCHFVSVHCRPNDKWSTMILQMTAVVRYWHVPVFIF